MENNTVNKQSKKTNHPAGKDDKTIITGMGIKQGEKELKAEGKILINTDLLRAGEFVSIKAYNGGNPNKHKATERNEDR